MKRLLALILRFWRWLTGKNMANPNQSREQIIAEKGVVVPMGSPPPPAQEGYATLPYVKDEDAKKLYITTVNGEQEIDLSGLSNLEAGQGVTIDTDQEGKTSVAVLQSPNGSIGDVAVDALKWEVLPEASLTMQDRDILVVNKSFPDADPTQRIDFLAFLALIAGRLQFTDVPTGPDAPGTVGNYAYKDGYLYLRFATGIGSFRWGRLPISFDFTNDPGTTIAPPTNLQAALSGSNINLTWTYQNAATGFELYVSAVDSQHFQKVNFSIGGTARSAVYTPPSLGVTYYFQLLANTTQGTSGPSNVANATAPPATNRWAAVQNLTPVANNASGSLDVSFTALNSGTIVRLDITNNVNAQADPADPIAQGWDDRSYITISSTGNKTVNIPNVGVGNWKVRALVFDEQGTKQGSEWVMAGPVTIASQVMVPLLFGAWNAGNKTFTISYYNRSSSPGLSFDVFRDTGSGYAPFSSYPPTVPDPIFVHSTPFPGTYKYKGRFQGKTQYGNELVLIVNQDGTLQSLTGNPEDGGNPDPGGGTSDGVTYALESRDSYDSGNYSPWEKFGKFQTPYEKSAVVNDFIGSEGNIKYALVSDLSNSLSNLGIRFPGIYYKGQDDYFGREVRDNRYLYLGQEQYVAVTPPTSTTNSQARQELWDPNPVGYDQDWQTDSGTIRVDSGTPLRWNIIYAWFNRDTNKIPLNSQFGMVRANVEGHEIESYNQVLRIRYLGMGGKFRPSRVGGTFAGDGPYSGAGALTDADYLTGKEPAYKDMSDVDFYIFYHRCQVSFDSFWYSKWQSENVRTIGYQGESQGGSIQEISGVRGYRRAFLFNLTGFDGKKYRDFMTASCWHGGDIMLDLTPFALAYTDQMDERYPEIQAYRLVRELGFAEDGTTRTGQTVSTPAEFYRMTISSDRKVKLQFEDRFGNTAATTRPMRIESALPKDSTGYGTTQVWAEIPVGSTEIEVQVNNDYLPRQSITEKVDDKLVDLFEWTALYYKDMASQGIEGYPVQNQVYAYAVGQRGVNFNLEITTTGQMPKEFAHGIRLMGATFNYMHVMYATTGVNGYRTMDHIYAAQKRLSKYNAHFNDNKKAVELEITLDGGNTWTSSTVSSWRTDLVSSGDFLGNNPQGYNAVWIRNRKSAGQASPLVFVSYNAVNNTVVIFEKVVYGTSLTYGFRFKKADGSYDTYLNRSITNKWKDSWGTTPVNPGPVTGTVQRAAVDYNPSGNSFVVAQVSPSNATMEAQLTSSGYSGQWTTLGAYGSTVGDKTYNTRMVVSNLPSGTYTIKFRTAGGTDVTTVNNVSLTSQGVKEFYPTTTPDPDPEPQPDPQGSLAASSYTTSN